VISKNIFGSLKKYTSHNLKFPSLWRYAEMVSRIGFSQVLSQIFRMAAGLILIRTTGGHKEEYAFFTIANTIQATVNVLSDMGGGSALQAKAGKVWQDTARMGQLIASYRHIKRFMSGGLGLLMAPVLFWLLTKNGAAPAYSLLIIATLGAEFVFYIETQNYLFVYQINTQIKKLQYAQLLPDAVRLALVAGAYFIFLNAWTALFASFLATVIQYIFLRKQIENFIGKDFKTQNTEDRQAIIRMMKSQLLYYIFYAFQGQLYVWLISFFGSPGGIAEVGALSRISVIFTVISGLMANLVFPAFIRCQQSERLKKLYFSILGGLLLLSVALTGLVWLFPDLILSVLGKSYAHLRVELLLLTVSSLLYQINGTVWSLNTNKAWVRNSWLIVPASICVQVLLTLVLNVSVVRDIILLNLFSILPALLINLRMSYRGFRQFKKAEQTALAPASAEKP
jgi:hypothetical protein